MLMKVRHEINEAKCDSALENKARLKYLDKSNLLSEAKEEALDRLTKMASKLLDVPLTIVSAVGKEKQVFKSFYGLPEPWASSPSIPIDNSVCRYTFSGDILALEDASEQPLLKDNPALPALKLTAYLGIPLVTEEGHILGAFCAIDYKRRSWSEKEIEILKELTHSVMSEISLKLALKELELRQREREKMIAMVAHDLRSPLNVALLSAEIIETESGSAKDVKEEASRIIRSMELASSLTNEFLDHELALFNSKNIEKEKFDLIQLVKSAASDLKKTMEGELIFGELPKHFEIFANETGVSRALINLISNAIKYGDKTRPIKINVNEVESNQVEISVHNFGQTLSEENKEQIFSPFVRGAEADKVAEGKGLGLALVNSVAEQHAGSLDFTSDEQAGTTFFLTLPRQ